MPTLPLMLTADPDDPGAYDLSIEAEIAGETVRVIVDTGGSSCSFAATGQTEDLDVGWL